LGLANGGGHGAAPRLALELWMVLAPTTRDARGPPRFHRKHLQATTRKPGTLVLASQRLELFLKCPERLNDVSRALPHAEVVGYSAETGIRFVDRRMLHFPKEASQHRDHLIFSLDLVALPARAVVFERLNVAVVFDGVCSPGGEDLTQFAIDFCQPSPRERKDANAGKVVQACQRIVLWPALVESRPLLVRPKLLKRALARFDPALHGQSFVPLQPSRD